MAYINEFPNWDSNKLNLDWILEQYSTFNQRIQEIQDHFDEVAQGMGELVAELEQDFTEFQTTVNGQLDQFEEDIQQQLTSGLTDIQQQVTFISSNMASYIAEHMNEWQAEADYSNHVMKFSNEASPTEDLTKTVYQIQLDGTLHRLGLKPPTYLVSDAITGIVNNQLQGVNDIVLEGKGTYLVIMSTSVSWGETTTPFKVTLNSQIPEGVIGFISIGQDGYVTSDSGSSALSGIGVFVNTTDLNKAVSPRLLSDTLQDESASTGAFYGCAIRICDEWSPVTT